MIEKILPELRKKAAAPMERPESSTDTYMRGAQDAYSLLLKMDVSNVVLKIIEETRAEERRRCVKVLRDHSTPALVIRAVLHD